MTDKIVFPPYSNDGNRHEKDGPKSVTAKISRVVHQDVISLSRRGSFGESGAAKLKGPPIDEMTRAD